MFILSVVCLVVFIVLVVCAAIAKKEDYDDMSHFFCLLSVVAFAWFVIIAYYGFPKEGHYEVLSGKVKYERVMHADSTITWERVK